jgi:tetratricopeptide (TPR) repeat protein
VLTAQSEPYIPKDASQLLERLRTTAFDPLQHQLRELRAKLSSNPTNSILAAQVARCCIDKYRSDTDPRYLGRAEAALAPWWNAAKPPVSILVLRATIKQSQHDFTNSLADLDLAIHLEPRNAQAWLTRATILTVLGNYDAARKACIPLAQLAPGLIAITAAANVACLSGGAQRASSLLRAAIDGNPSASPSEKLWALTLLAETYERLGNKPDAQRCFTSAMALAQPDPYLLGACADFLLDEGHPAEVVDLLKNQTRADGLLLRLTLAEAAIVPHPGEYQAHVDSLAARFEAGHLRGDFVHQREEARFQLELLHNPQEALRLAEANWKVQHEPADARIFLEAARAAGKAEAALPAVTFAQTNKLEDIALK